MTIRRFLRATLASGLALLLACPPARALVSLNDGHDHIYVTTALGSSWDSNVFANSEAKSDYLVSSSIVAEYSRRAGWIGVNGTLALESSRYGVLHEEDFANPKFGLELTKQTGRTTGSLTLNAARSSRADAAVNVRNVSWKYSAGLNFRYPIVTIYTLSGQIGYSLVKYDSASAGGADSTSSSTEAAPARLQGALFPDLATYTASLDLIRIFSTERDVMLGYRYRHSETSVDSTYDDHSVSVGMTGKLIRGVNGSLRTGYQIRSPHGFTDDGKPQSAFSSWTAAGSATYAFSKRMNFTGTLAKDFSTTATDTSVDTTTASLDGQYAYSSHWSLSGTISAGDSKFLGDSGRMVISLGPPLILGPSRHDNFASANVSLNYSMNEHLRVAASYVWFKNWSTSPYADFVRNTYNLNVSSRW